MSAIQVAFTPRIVGKAITSSDTLGLYLLLVSTHCELAYNLVFAKKMKIHINYLNHI